LERGHEIAEGATPGAGVAPQASAQADQGQEGKNEHRDFDHGGVSSAGMDILPSCPCLSTPPVERSVAILATNGPQFRGMLGPCPPSFYLISCPSSERESLSPHV